MSESESDSTERTVQTNPGASEVPLGVQYSPTEEERKVLKECDRESFWYRSSSKNRVYHLWTEPKLTAKTNLQAVPISLSSMALTQFLVFRGTLSPSARFGSLPKVLFAGVCGYFAGKLSYMRTCQEKFYRLEDSAIGDALRQRRRHRRPLQSGGIQSEGHAESPNFSLGDFTPDVQGAPGDDVELRSRNRESYDRTPRDPPAKEVKKNKYGDAWED